MILITGCARSGTKYIATVCKAAGMDVLHEQLGADGAASWIWAVGAEVYPAYHAQGKRPVFDLVLHQVREPLATIASCTSLMRGTWDWICRYAPGYEHATAHNADMGRYRASDAALQRNTGSGEELWI